MAITEAEIRIAALQELSDQPNGKLTTSQLIDILTRRFQPTGVDAQLLAGRNDTHLSQKVRNLVSHKDASTSLESKGYAKYDPALEGWSITPQGRDYISRLA